MHLGFKLWPWWLEGWNSWVKSISCVCLERDWGRACWGWVGSLYWEFHVKLCRELYWLCTYAHQGCCLLKERLFTNTLGSYFYVAFLYLWILPASLLLCLNDRQKNLIDVWVLFLVLIYGFDIKSKFFKVQILYIVCLQFMILLMILIFLFINYSVLFRTFNWWALKEEVRLDSRGAHRGESLGLLMPLLNSLVLHVMW